MGKESEHQGSDYAEYYTGQDGREYTNQPAPVMHQTYARHYDEESPINNRNSDDKFKPANHRRDPAWTIVFLVHLVAFFVLFVFAAVKYQAVMKDQQTTNTGNNTGNNEPYSDSTNLRKLLFSCMGMVALSLIFAGVWLQVIKTFATQIIYITLVLSSALWIAFSIYLFSIHSIFGGIITLLAALLHIFLWFSWRSRIPFASLMLRTVSGVTQRYHGMTVISYLSLFVSIFWIVLWVLTVIFLDQGLSSKVVDQNGQSHIERPTAVYVLYVFLLLSFYWVAQVIKNVVHVTTSGTVASWYFLYGTEAMPVNPSIASFKRATGTSFGSICLGSLIIAALQTIRTLLRGLRGNHDILNAIIDCFLSIIENLVRYFNKYAFAQIAIYGKSYCEAAKDTWAMFEQHGFMAVVNDDITGTVLGMSTLLGGVLNGVLGAILSVILFPQNSNALAAMIIFGFLIGLLLCSQVMEVLESGITTIFVSFVMDPAVLARNSPELYAQFQERYSEEDTQGGRSLLYPTTLHTPTRRSSQMKSSMKRSNPLSDSDAELGKKRIRVARPPNSFLLFSNATRSALKRQNPHLNNAQLAKLLGTTWKTLHPDEKKRFTERADRIKTNYFKINPIPITEDADTIQPESVRPQSALELLEAALHTGPSPPEPDYQETLDFIEGYMTERKITGYSEEDIDSFTTVSSTLTPNTSLPSTPSSQFSLGERHESQGGQRKKGNSSSG
ncbi:hypothetical protein PROFUN_14268, partial [Planoprotostelium fungivorum]